MPYWLIGLTCLTHHKREPTSRWYPLLMLRCTSPSLGLLALVRITFSGNGVLTVPLPNLLSSSTRNVDTRSSMNYVMVMVRYHPLGSRTRVRFTPNTNDESTISVVHSSFMTLLICLSTLSQVPYASQSSV